MDKLIFLIALIIIALQSCKKEDKDSQSGDYRDKYIGNFEFKIYSMVKINYFGDSSTTSYDTTNHVGKVSKYESDRIRIEFSPNVTEPKLDEYIFPVSINGLIYPIMNISGKLSYPEINKTYGHSYGFSGSLTNDSLNFSYGAAFHGGSESHVIKGYKLN